MVSSSSHNAINSLDVKPSTTSHEAFPAFSETVFCWRHRRVLVHFRTVPRMARHFLISLLFVHNACLRVANPSVQRGNETRPTRDLPKIGRRCGHAQYSRRGLFLIGLWQLLDGRIQLRPQFVQSTAGIGQSALLRLQLRSHFRCSGRTLLLRINCIG